MTPPGLQTAQHVPADVTLAVKQSAQAFAWPHNIRGWLMLLTPLSSPGLGSSLLAVGLTACSPARGAPGGRAEWEGPRGRSVVG